MKRILLGSEEKFFRNFDKTVTFAGPLSRFRLCERDCISGYRRGRSICMYRKKKGVFALFSTTLYGTLTPDKKAIRYGFFRPLGVLTVYLLWCASLLAAGLLLLSDDPGMALCFFLPGFILLFPAFVFPRREKKILSEALEAMVCQVPSKQMAKNT